MHECENINQTDKDAHVLVPYVASQSGDLLCSKLQVFLFKERKKEDVKSLFHNFTFKICH